MPFVFMSALTVFILIWCGSSVSAKPDDAGETISYAFGEWEPIIYRVDDQTKGMYQEIMHEVFEVELGLKLEFRLRPWKRAQSEVQSGSSDLLITIPTAARQEYALISQKPVFKLYFGVYTYVDHPRLEEISKIKNIRDIVDLKLTAVTNLGNGWHKENVQNKGVITFEIPRDRNLAQVLALRRADIMIDSPVTMNHIIKKNKLTDNLILTDVAFLPVNMHLMLSKKSRYVERMPEIDQAIGRMIDDGRLAQIHKRYDR